MSHFLTTKLRNYISFLRQHKQADPASNDARLRQSLCARRPKCERAVTSAEIFRGHAPGHRPAVELVCTPDATSALGCSPWRKKRDHPSQVQTAPLRIPETYVLYNYNVKIYIASETAESASRGRS